RPPRVGAGHRLAVVHRWPRPARRGDGVPPALISRCVVTGASSRSSTWWMHIHTREEILMTLTDSNSNAAVLPNGQDRSQPFARFADQKTIALTTYRRDGTPVVTPVPIAVDGSVA